VTYLSEKPSPLEKQAETQAYSPAAITRLLEKLREANLSSELTKGELLSILNLRPSSSALLSTAIEDMEERFSEEEQNKIVDIIAEVLGRAETADKGGEGGDEMDADAVPSVENGY
jgi:DNA-binding MarR family transcriptional regulator